MNASKQLALDYKREKEREMLQFVRKQQNETRLAIIEEGTLPQNIIDEDHIHIKDTSGRDVSIYVTDAWDSTIPDGIFLYYDTDQEITVKNTFKNHNSESGQAIKKEETYKTKTLVVSDPNPTINFQSTKNIVQTQVQGRDYTRKELVSGGDLEFTVSGAFFSNLAAMDTMYNDYTKKTESVVVYPEKQVQKFIQMMQYPGIINVHNRIFRQFNVERIVIKSFSLGEQTCKNIQPYSFTCVAIEPDEDVLVREDTITAVDWAIATSPLNDWWTLVLETKLAEIAGDVMASGAAVALDKLTVNASI